MSENISIAEAKKLKQKTVTRKGPLSVINGDVSSRKRTIKKGKSSRYELHVESVLRLQLKQLCKNQRPENFVAFSHLSDRQKFQIFEDVEKEYMTKDREDALANDLAASNVTSNANTTNDFENALATSNEEATNDSENDYETALKNDLACSNETSPSFSPEYVESSPEETQKEPLFSYSKKKEASSDLLWCTPYRDDIYMYFKAAEQNFRPNPNYMEKQRDLNMKMRSILIDWCTEVAEEYKLQAETLYLSVSFIDRFLSQVSVLRGKLQLVGTASMFLAAKYEEIYPPELKDFVFITDNTYTKQQILRMEHLLLKVLNFDLTVPTAYTFLQLFLSLCDAPDILKHLSEYICEITLLDGDPFLKFSPSLIAAGSLALSNYILGFAMWDKSMEDESGYRLVDLYHIIQFLYCKLNQMPSSTEKAIYEKYKAPKYGSASLIQYPDRLVFPYLLESCSCSYC